MAGIDLKSTFDAGRITEDLLNRKLTGMRRAAEFAKGDVLSRTASGVGLEGSFPGYSESYARFRARTQHPTSPVRLFYSGDMLGSLHTRAFVEGLNLVFEIAPTPDQGAKVGWTNRQRPWFALKPDEIASAIKTVQEA